MPRQPLPITSAILLMLGGSTVALAQTAPGAVDTFEPTTLAGSYLAGRSAEADYDLESAVRFYGKALESDDANPQLLERIVMLQLATGDMSGAFQNADRLVAIAPGNPISRVALAVQSLARGDYGEGRDGLARISPAQLATLTAGLLMAWAQFGDGLVDEAIETLDALTGPTWYVIFKDYHRALLLDAAGRTKEAVEHVGAAYDSDGTALRIVEGYARIMARAGRRAEAIEAITDFAGEVPLHPIARTLLDSLRSGVTPDPIASDARTGAAEVLYGLGSAIGGDNGPELPAAYLRLSTYLNPDAPLATMAVGDVFQDAERCGEAIAVYESIPATEPLRRNADIQIGNCLESIDQLDQAAARIRRVADANPADFEAAIELGNVYRSNQKFELAAEAYSQGIDHLPKDADGIWRIYYFRGISYERSSNWPLAEADFKRALELNPDQPHVLNYLGYSWVDMGENLDPALDMIRTAVEIRPNDGYIVDSLGWAYYRLGRFEDAVAELERAVELRPEDPVINDHLGDALWWVDRRREAVFQWAHARDLDPGEDELAIILDKIENGLSDKPLETLQPEAAALPETLIVAAGDSLWSIAQSLYGDGLQFLRLLEANADIIGEDNVIIPGMELVIPPADGN